MLNPALNLRSGGRVKTFLDADVADGFTGYFDLTTNSTRRYWYSANKGGWEGWVCGHSCQMTLNNSTQTLFSVSVDGHPAFTPHVPVFGASLTFYLFRGLPDGWHYVQIYTTGVTNLRSPQGSIPFLSVRGENPRIETRPTAEEWYLTDPSFPGAHTFCTQARVAGANILPDIDDIFTGRDGAGPGVSGLDDGYSIKFTGTCSEIWLHTGDTVCYLSVDGAAYTVADLTDGDHRGGAKGNGARSWVRAFVGLDGAASHDYYIFPGNVTAKLVDVNATVGTDAVRLDPAGTFDTMPATKLVKQYGDSITKAEFGPTIFNGLTAGVDCDVYTYCAALDALGCGCGISGASAATLYSNMATSFANRVFVEDIAVLAVGQNDVGTDPTAFKATYTSILNAILSNGTDKIACRGIELGNSRSEPNDGTISDAVSAIQASLTGAQEVVFIDTTGWTGITTYDGIHPTRAGYITLAGHMATELALTGFF